jgi:hypothetical protein
LPKLSQVSDTTVARILQNAALMYDIANSQRRHAVEIARANGWTYERIAPEIGRSYPAARALDPNVGADA